MQFLFASTTPASVENYKQTRQKVNNLSKKICVIKILQEWASIVLNFSKCEIKGTLPKDSQYEMTR